MKFSAQEEYGLRCMIAIASEGENGFLTIPLIAKAEGMTQSHVAKLLAILRRGGFVTSTRGQLGGYALSRPASQIDVKNLLITLGGRLYDEKYCDRHSGVLDECIHFNKCRVGPLWRNIQGAVDGAIEGITLQDLVTTTPVCNVEMHLSTPPKVVAK